MARIRSIGTIFLVLISLLLLLSLIVLPAVASLLIQNRSATPESLDQILDFNDRLIRSLMLSFFVAWVFFLGATFASFLNVVAWRVPHGRTILGSSHCPSCAIKLTFRDNIPIVGWLKNAGRCSHCNAPISVRYLLVEIVLGFLFLAVAAMISLTGGMTLPFLQADSALVWEQLAINADRRLFEIIGFYLAMILVLYTYALIELEWLKIPVSIWSVGTVAGVAILAIFPEVMLVDWQFPFHDRLGVSSGWGDMLAYAGCGIITGALVGKLMDYSQYLTDQPNSFVFAMTTVGLFLGWQSALVIAGLASTLLLLTAQYHNPNRTLQNIVRSPHANVLLSTLIHLSTWRWFESITPWG